MKWCESESVWLLWLSDATADSDARCPAACCWAADTAAAALSNRSQESRALRDGAAVCESPAGGTGHLNLQENSSVGKALKEC